MADIVAGSVTYTESAGKADKTGGPRSKMRRQFDLAFGDAALQYRTATGVPLTAAKLGMPSEVAVLTVIGRTKTAAGTNYVWEWNKNATSPALVGFEVRTGPAGPEGATEIADTTAIVLQTIRVEVEGF